MNVMTNTDQQKPAILLVDDVPLILDLLQDILEGQGHRVLRSELGSKVPEILDQEQISLVFCDVSLPDVHGVEVLRMIKQHTPEIQVIMISGQQDFDVARQVLRERALDYLVKPFSQAEVLDAVEQGFAAYEHATTQSLARIEAQRRMADLVLLKQIGETANSGGDLQELFDQILDSIVESAGVEVASLMLLEDDGLLHIASARGLSEKIINSVRVAAGEGVSGHVLATREPVLISNLQQDSRFKSLVGGERYSTQSLLSVPIMVREEMLGVINVNNKISGGSFDFEDQNLLVAIANQVALAMENFKLVNSLRLQADTLERTNEDLVRMNRARTRLVCNLSHELKTPAYLDYGLCRFVSDLLLQADRAGIQGSPDNGT